MENIQKEIGMLAVRMGLLRTDILSSVTELSDKSFDICRGIFERIDNANDTNVGHLFVCAGMASYGSDNAQIVLDTVSNLCDTSSIEEFLLDYCGIDGEEGEDFITHCNALYRAAIGLLMENVQKDSPNDETIVDSKHHSIIKAARLLMFRIGMAIQKEAQQS